VAARAGAGGENYRDLKELIGRCGCTRFARARLAQHGRMLEPSHGHVHDPGERVHAALRFCAVEKGAPLPVDYDEPQRVAARWEPWAQIRGDHQRQPRRPQDGGAELFALTIRAIRERVPGCGIEVLTPDFKASAQPSRPSWKPPGRVQPQHRDRAEAVSPGAPGRALRALPGVLAHAKRVAPGTPAKSGLMLGLARPPGKCSK